MPMRRILGLAAACAVAGLGYAAGVETRWFALRPDRRLGVSLHSFSYKRGVPRGLDLMFDCRFLANPHWEPNLRPLDGRDDRLR